VASLRSAAMPSMLVRALKGAGFTPVSQDERPRSAARALGRRQKSGAVNGAAPVADPLAPSSQRKSTEDCARAPLRSVAAVFAGPAR
jgi:hypothetical protein